MPRKRHKKPAPDFTGPCPELMKLTMDAPGGVWDLEVARKHVESCPHCQHIMRGGMIGQFKADLANLIGDDKPDTEQN